MTVHENGQNEVASNAALEVGSRSAPSSPKAMSISSSEDRPRPSRAETEPINVAGHPELYERLHFMWQQTNDLLSSQAPSIRRVQSVVEVDTPQSMSIQGLMPLQQTGSIVDTHIFNLLYRDRTNLNHFAATKQELPFHETVQNQEYLGWVAAKEPGNKVDYDIIRNLLARLSREATLREKSPNIFSFFNGLLRAHDLFILRGARFLSYDLWMNMVDSYYGTRGDIGLLSLFPVTAPATFQNYVTTSVKAMSEAALENRRRNWSETRDQWLDAEKVIVRIKSSKEFHRRYDQLHKLTRIFTNSFDLRMRRNRALRAIQANRRVERRRMIKTAHIQAWRNQVGQSEIDELPGGHIVSPDAEMLVLWQSSEQVDTFDMPQKLSDQMQQMNIDHRLAATTSSRLD